MKEKIKQKILKYLRIILPISLLIYLYELTIGNYISFGNLSIDYLFYYTTLSLFLFNLACVALYLYCIQKRKSLKIISLIIFFPVGLLFLIYFPLNIDLVTGTKNYDKYYFYEKNNTKYYIISERFTALDGPELKIYEEKPIIGFIKERVPANEQKLIKYGVDVSKAMNIYIDKYF